MRVPRVKGIQRLGGEARVTKNCPAVPMVHGALHLRPGGGQSVGILRWRSIRLAPCARLPLQTRRWSLAGRSWVGNSYAHSPAGTLSPAKVMSIQTLPRNFVLNNNRKLYRCGDVSIRAALLFRLLGRTDPCWPVAVASASCPEAAPCETPWYMVVRNAQV